MVIEISIIAFLVILGIALFLAEIFFLPGITLAGIAGGLSLLGGIIYAFTYVGTTAGYVTITASALMSCAAFIYMIKSNAMSRIALNTDIESKVDQEELLSMAVGDRGTTISRLNPIGKAEFNNLIVEAKSVTGEYIDENVAIEIVKVETYNVLVKEITL